MEAYQFAKSDSSNSPFAMLNSEKKPLCSKEPQLKDKVYNYVGEYDNLNIKVTATYKKQFTYKKQITNENTNHFMINSEELPKGLVISSLD